LIVNLYCHPNSKTSFSFYSNLYAAASAYKYSGSVPFVIDYQLLTALEQWKASRHQLWVTGQSQRGQTGVTQYSYILGDFCPPSCLGWP